MSSRSNPFSTRFVRPGAIPYQFFDSRTAGDLVTRLAEFQWRGQIVGPHGSGKSTLLASLLEPLRRSGRPAWGIGLHDGERRLPTDWIQQASRAAARLIVIDGYEQLSRWNRMWVKVRCRQHDWGLLVTAHDDVGFHTLFCTSVTLSIARSVVDQLLSLADASAISDEVVAEQFQAARGDMRETLFRLYDHYEQQHLREVAPFSRDK